jgi:hypothetical protein
VVTPALVSRAGVIATLAALVLPPLVAGLVVLGMSGIHAPEGAPAQAGARNAR